MDEPLVWYEGSGTGDKRFLSADERGSVIAVTDGGGALLGANRYDEFGNPSTSASGSGLLFGRFGYTGQAWLPELKLWHYKARAYHPQLGRFLQADPIGYGGGPNLYIYPTDPMNFADPLGLLSEAEKRNRFVQPTDPDYGEEIVVTGQRWRCYASESDSGLDTITAMALYDEALHSHSSGGEGGDEEIVVTGKRKRPQSSQPAQPARSPPAALPPSIFVPAAAVAESSERRSFCGSSGTQAVPDRLGGTDISGACAVHDACYGSSTSKETCDLGLLNNIWEACSRQSRTVACYAGGLVYYWVLRGLGGPAYRRGRQDD